MGVGGAAPPAGLPPTHCRRRPGRHCRELFGLGPGARGYLETGASLNERSVLLVAEPSAAWWSTPSEERRRYLRDFYAVPANRDKKRKRQRRYYYRHREKRLDAVRKVNYQISAEVYRQMLTSQNELCAICSCPSNSTYRGRKRQLAVDHDHLTGQIRGLLCNGCNAGLGYFRSNPQFLVAAAEYLALSAQASTVGQARREPSLQSPQVHISDNLRQTE